MSFKPTPSPWEVQNGISIVASDECGPYGTPVVISTMNLQMNRHEAEDNALMIVKARNIYEDLVLIAKESKEAIESLKRQLIAHGRPPAWQTINLLNRINEAILKIEKT